MGIDVMTREERLNRQRMVRMLYPSTSNAELAEMLGISVNHVHVMAHRMGLRKDPAFLSETNRRNGRKGLVAMKKKCKL